MTYLLMFAFHNFFESHLLETRSFEYLLFAAITTSLGFQHRVIRARTAPAEMPSLQPYEGQVYSPFVR
jgi:hypothetical protein